MSDIVHLPRSGAPDQASVDAQSEKVAEAIRMLLSALPVSQQHRILSELTDALRPIPTPRAGKVLGAIVRLLPRHQEWQVAEVKKQVAAEGVKATTKEIYNALGYLTRKGHVQRIGYGRYLVGGAGLITNEDLGGEPARYEDD